MTNLRIKIICNCKHVLSIRNRRLQLTGAQLILDTIRDHLQNEDYLFIIIATGGILKGKIIVRINILLKSTILKITFDLCSFQSCGFKNKDPQNSDQKQDHSYKRLSLESRSTCTFEVRPSLEVRSSFNEQMNNETCMS